MNLTKLFQFEKKQKSRLYKEVEYLVTNYDLIKSFYSTYAEFCGSEKRITLRDIIPCESPMLGRYKATEIFEIIENFPNKIDCNDTQDNIKINSVFSSLLKGRKAYDICKDLCISQHTYCNCRFIVINHIAKLFESYVYNAKRAS